MAVAEALARGLPVISTRTGAIPELVGAEAGLIVPPGNVDLISAALTRAISDQCVRADLAVGASRVRERLPTWDAAVDRLIAILEPIVREGRVTAF